MAASNAYVEMFRCVKRLRGQVNSLELYSEQVTHTLKCSDV